MKATQHNYSIVNYETMSDSKCKIELPDLKQSLEHKRGSIEDYKKCSLFIEGQIIIISVISCVQKFSRDFIHS